MPLLMQIATIPGESEVAGHTTWHPLLGFSWGGTRESRSMNVGSHRADTRVWAPQLRHASIRRFTDSRSALFWEAAFRNMDIGMVKFEWLRTGEGAPVCFFAITLTGVRILRLSAGAVGGRPIEDVDLSYREIELGVRDVGNTLTGAQDIVTYKVPSHEGG
ncbi:type VI secretion system tube protein Hcp [Roseomonas sp. HJA6]|uniref:Type VI secretion system tube protein Hcp n=1 Tax=Roseomonas alba TaxID=2846776 RepID=A0ABS7AII3_9PROT|nr:type VI secretion system tube protein Hcp [Neoroseomonas alba]MBW6400954.1 type VI secretion system tube protein Hcp [Neoroseomonas alba]